MGFLILSSFSFMGPAQAQNIKELVQNQADRIQQASLAGQLNKRQTSDLQNRMAQIMYQEVQSRNANNGRLTDSQRRSIDQSLRNLDRDFLASVSRNDRNAVIEPLDQWRGDTYRGQHWQPPTNWYNSRSQSWRSTHPNYWSSRYHNWHYDRNRDYDNNR